MLDNSYFDDSRLKMYEEMKKRYNLVCNPPPVKLECDYVKLIEKDLLLSNEVFLRIKDYYPHLVPFLICWTRKFKLKRNNITEICVSYPVYDNVENDLTKDFIFSSKTFSNFFFHKMYTDNPDFEGFDSIELIGGTLFHYDIPAGGGFVDDGQLKITVDAALAIDALGKKENLNVLVIGSAAEGVVCGLAYDAISCMVKNSTFHLYDPSTVDCSYMLDTNQFSHHASIFSDFSNLDSFDIVLDDSWVHDSYITEDFRRDVYNAKNFSVKCLPGEVFPKGKRYDQAFKTNGEFRAVSRDVVFDYNFHPLGSCFACVELKYLLKNTYCADFYSRIMDVHRVNCLTKQTRSYEDVFEIKKSFVEIQDPGDILRSFKKIQWDTDIDGEGVPLNANILKCAFIKISHERFLTSFIVNHCPVIVRCDDDGKFYFLGDQAAKFGFREIDIKFGVRRVAPYNMYKQYMYTSSMFGDDYEEIRMKVKKKWVSKKFKGYDSIMEKQRSAFGDEEFKNLVSSMSGFFNSKTGDLVVGGSSDRRELVKVYVKKKKYICQMIERDNKWAYFGQPFKFF